MTTWTPSYYTPFFWTRPFWASQEWAIRSNRGLGLENKAQTVDRKSDQKPPWTGFQSGPYGNDRRKRAKNGLLVAVVAGLARFSAAVARLRTEVAR